MKTYTDLRNLYGTLTKNTGTANLTLGDTLIDDEYRTILNKRDWHFLEKIGTETTVALQEGYELPGDCNRVSSVYVQNGSNRYTPIEAQSREYWDRLNLTTFSSDIPTHYIQFGKQLLLYPKPASSGQTINYIYKRAVKKLSVADYTTGTVTTATNGSTAIVGSGTSWTTGMAGSYIKITNGSAANLGDGLWYEIATVNSSTSITLTREYAGTSITAGSAAYTIGEVSLLPEDYQDLPVYEAVAKYWDKEDDPVRAQSFRNMKVEKLNDLIRDHGSRTTNPVIYDGRDRPIINPNLTIIIP